VPAVPASALGLALSAAVVHALWNLLLARARDPQAAAAVATAVGVALWAPVALIVGHVSTGVLPYVPVSAALELLYFVLLAGAYRVGELSVTYPLARGLAPVLLVLAAAAGLGGDVAALQVAGIALVAGGVVAVRGGGGRGGWREVALAGGVAVCIAGYTLVDRAALRHGAEPIAYLWLVMALVAPPYLAAMWRARGATALRAQLGLSTVVAGVAIFGAYALVLGALKLASAAAVGAVRETSVVLVTAFAALVLHESVSRRRWAGALAVTAGIVLIALG
jgi:drug/metabolite transporter (DMT)-like permease